MNTKTTYTVVCKTDNCGHKHTSYENAEKCQNKLLNFACQYGHRKGQWCSGCRGTAKITNCSSKWYSSNIEVNE